MSTTKKIRFANDHTEGTDEFKQGFVASDGSRVVNEPEAEALAADDIDRESLTVTKKKA